jgi:gamma-glutamyltranspeptidase
MKDSGTSHLSVMDKFGNNIGITTTVNLNFGSKVASNIGIVFNNQMDDFTTSNKTNSFGYEPSISNTVSPFKTPMSSMSPTMVLDPKGNVMLSLGGSGGVLIF